MLDCPNVEPGYLYPEEVGGNGGEREGDRGQRMQRETARGGPGGMGQGRCGGGMYVP